MSRTGLLIGASLLVLAGVGAFFFLQGDSEPEGLGLGNSNVAEESALDTRENPQPLEDDPEAITPSAFVENEDEEVELALGLHPVLVVNEEEAPVAGAKVTILRGNRDFGGFGPFGGDDENGEQVVAEGKTGTDGTVFFDDLPGRRLNIRARLGDRVGYASYDPGDRAADAQADEPVARIQLRPIKTLEIAVINPNGKPVGPVPVRIRAAEGEGGGRGRGRGRRGRRGGFGRQRWTDRATGKILLEITPEDSELYEAEQVVVSATVWGQDAREATLALETGKKNSVQVEVPFTVTVLAKIREESGSLPKKSLRVSWRMIDENGENGGRRGRNRWMNSFGNLRWTPEQKTADAREGIVRIAGFPLGAKVSFNVTSSDRIATEKSHTLSTSAAEETVDLKVGAELPTLVARLVEPDGKPLVRERLDIRLEYDEDDQGRDPGDRFRRMMLRGSSNRNVRTDKDGRIKLHLQPELAGSIELNLRGRGDRGFRFGGRRGRGGRGGFGGGDDQDSPPPLASITFPAVLAGEEHDAGEVKADRGPVLASGVVVDAAGKPVASLRVRAEAVREENADGRFPFFGRPSQRLGAVTNKEGQFEIRAHSQGSGRYELRAEGKGLRSAEQVVPHGTTQVSLKVVRTGGLAGKVVLVDPALKLRPELRFRPEGAERRGASRNARVDRRTGEFKVEGLTPGRYDLQVFVSGREEQVIPGLEVPEGEIGKPAALQELRVGEGYALAEVSVVDAQGQPVANARVDFSVSTEQQPQDNARGGRRGRRRGRRTNTARTNPAGVATQAIRLADKVEVSVSARGFARASVSQASFPLRVTLQRPADLVITWAQPIPQIPNNGGNLQLVLIDPKTQLPAADAEPREWMTFIFRNMRRSTRLRPGATETKISDRAAGIHDLYIGLVPRNFGRGGPDFKLPLKIGQVAILAGNETRVELDVDPKQLLSHFGF